MAEHSPSPVTGAGPGSVPRSLPSINEGRWQAELSQPGSSSPAAWGRREDPVGGRRGERVLQRVSGVKRTPEDQGRRGTPEGEEGRKLSVDPTAGDKT